MIIEDPEEGDYIQICDRFETVLIWDESAAMDLNGRFKPWFKITKEEYESYKFKYEGNSVSKMKPCPFCNSKNVSFNSKITYGQGEAFYEGFILCKDCRAKGPESSGYGSPEKLDEYTCCKKWNYRVD